MITCTTILFQFRPFLGSGFTKVPGGPEYQDVSAFSWHAYCWAMDLTPPDAPDANKTAAVELCMNGLLPQVCFFNFILKDLLTPVTQNKRPVED